MTDILAVTHAGGATLTFFDTSDWSKPAIPTFAGNAAWVDIHPSGTQIALATDDATYPLQVFTSDYTPITITGGQPGSQISRLRYSPDGAYLAVTSNNAPRLTVYDTTTWAKESTPTGPDAVALACAWSPDSSKLSVGFAADPFLLVLNAGTWTTITLAAAHTASTLGVMGFKPDGSLLLTAMSPFLSRYATTGWARTDFFGPGNYSGALEWSPDGARVAVGRTANHYLRFLNPADWSAYSPAAVPPGRVNEVRWRASDGMLAAPHNTTPYLAVYNSSLTAVSFTPALPGNAQGAAWGTLVVVPAYSVVPDVTAADEGDTVTFTATADDDGTYYWTLAGDLDALDVVGGALSGSFTITGGTGTIAVVLRNDGRADGEKVFTLEMRTVSISGDIVATSDPVTVTDTSTAPIYTIEPDDTTVNEGATVTYTVGAIGVADSTTLYWQLAQTGFADLCNQYDLVGNVDSGSFTITGEAGSFDITLKNDFSSDGTKNLVVRLFEVVDDDEVNAVATADTVVVADTSNPSAYTFDVATYINGGLVVGGTGAANEGDTVSIIVTASPVPPAGTRISWGITGTADGADYSFAGSGWSEFSGAGIVEWEIDIDEDATTEGSETLAIIGRANWPDPDGEILFTGATITIADTSRDPPTYAIDGPASVNEGATATVTVATTEVADGTTLYWTTEGDVSAADFVDGQLTGSVVIASGAASIPRAITADLLTEGDGFEDGDVASAASDTLIVTGAGWAVDEHVGHLVKITGGTGADQYRIVASNTSDTLTLTVAWAVVPDATSTYRLYTQTFRLLLRTGSVGGPVVAGTNSIRIVDTSVNPPEYDLSQSATTVAEGSSIGFTLTTAYVLDATLYWTISGSATGADFAEGGSGTVSGAGGTITLNALRDYLAEGSESFVLRIHTGSTGGPIVVSSDLVTVLDSGYSVTPSSTMITEGASVTFTVNTVNHPSATLYWTLIGSVDGGDFTGAIEGSVTIADGVGTVTLTAVDDGEGEGPEFFYLALRHTSVTGDIIAISPAVLLREAVPLDVDEWLAQLDGVRVLLVEMDHADGTIYFGNHPYISHPDDTNPHRPYDDLLTDAIDIETRIDGDFTLGEIDIVNDGGNDSWIDHKYRGYPVRIYLGEPEWPLDDFRLVALATNGGIIAIEAGLIRWGIYDAKAVFAVPLQNNLLDDNNPIPIALGKPFNVTPVLLDDPTHEYQINDGAVVSIAVRDNGAAITPTVDTGAGTFTLTARPQGNIGADPITAVTTPAQIIAWVCSRYSVTLDGDTTAELPVYEVGLYYASQASAADVLTAVCQSLGGYWLVNPLGVVEVYQLEEPAVTADFVIGPDDVEDRGLRLLAMEPPVKTLTLNYQRNWSPVSRDSLAGILDTSPAFAESLTKEWRQVTAVNDVSDYPLAQDHTINTYLISETDAQAECNRIALLRAVRRERWELDCYLSAAQAQVGRTVQIINPRFGFDAGRNARVVAVRRSLSRNRVTLEVWL